MKKPLFSMNALDRAISWVAPSLALQRARSRAAMSLASGYQGARRDKPSLAQWSALAATSADFDTLADLPVLRARSRDLVRNDPLAQSAIQTKAQNVIGPGHVVRPEIDAARLGLSEEAAEAWEEAALAIWREWSESPESRLTGFQIRISRLTARGWRAGSSWTGTALRGRITSRTGQRWTGRSLPT